MISMVLLTTLVLLKNGLGPTCAAWRFIAYVVHVQVWVERLSVKALMLTPLQSIVFVFKQPPYMCLFVIWGLL